MQPRTIDLLVKRGNPMRLLAEGEAVCDFRSYEFNEEMNLWEVSIQVAWYMLDAYIEMDPMGELAPAGDSYWTWLDGDTADMINALPLRQIWRALDLIEDCAKIGITMSEMMALGDGCKAAV